MVSVHDIADPVTLSEQDHHLMVSVQDITDPSTRCNVDSTIVPRLLLNVSLIAPLELQILST